MRDESPLPPGVPATHCLPGVFLIHKLPVPDLRVKLINFGEGENIPVRPLPGPEEGRVLSFSERAPNWQPIGRTAVWVSRLPTRCLAFSVVVPSRSYQPIQNSLTLDHDKHSPHPPVQPATPHVLPRTITNTSFQHQPSPEPNSAPKCAPPAIAVPPRSRMKRPAGSQTSGPSVSSYVPSLRCPSTAINTHRTNHTPHPHRSSGSSCSASHSL
jgi:hypothetical protein